MKLHKESMLKDLNTVTKWTHFKTVIKCYAVRMKDYLNGVFLCYDVRIYFFITVR